MGYSSLWRWRHWLACQPMSDLPGKWGSLWCWPTHPALAPRHWLERQPMRDLPGKWGSLLYDADPRTQQLRHWLARQPISGLPGKWGSLLYDADPRTQQLRLNSSAHSHRASTNYNHLNVKCCHNKLPLIFSPLFFVLTSRKQTFKA